MPLNRWQRGRLTGTEGANLLYYRSHIREACQNDHVMCLECGLTLKSLPQHLCKHHLTDDEYKAKWGSNRTTPLISGIALRGLRRRALAMNLAAYSPPSLRKALKARCGRRSPYRPEQRLAQIEVARNRIAVGLRLRRPKKEKHYPTCHGRADRKHQNYRPRSAYFIA